MHRAVCFALALFGIAGCTPDDGLDNANTSPDPTSHDKFFPIAPGGLPNAWTATALANNPHAVDCNFCHGKYDTFTLFDCLGGCHVSDTGDLVDPFHTQAKTDPDHLDLKVMGYSYDSASCLKCHPRGVPTDVGDHDQFFPISAMTPHKAIACDNCHADINDRRHLSCTNTTCHVDGDVTPKHADVGGYDYSAKPLMIDSGDGTGPHSMPVCLRCHADGQVNAVAMHSFNANALLNFMIKSPYTHYKQACLDCHPKQRTDKPVGEDWMQFQCTNPTCHPQATADMDHNGIQGYMYADASCFKCHPTGAGGGIDHNLFPIVAGTDTHGVAGCKQCHADPNNRDNVSCAVAGCHDQADMTTKHALVGDFAYVSSTCLLCHADSQVNAVAAHMPFRIIPTSPHGKSPAKCLTCHPNRRTDLKPFGEDFNIFSCVGPCHSMNQVNGVGKHQNNPKFNINDPTSCVQKGCHDNGSAP
jgi:hypothetical protein